VDEAKARTWASPLREEERSRRFRYSKDGMELSNRYFGKVRLE
jgi:hypothetical protein